MWFILDDAYALGYQVDDIVYFEAAASQSNGLDTGCAIVTAKETNEDYKWNGIKYSTTRAITTRAEPRICQSFRYELFCKELALRVVQATIVLY